MMRFGIGRPESAQRAPAKRGRGSGGGTKCAWCASEIKFGLIKLTEEIIRSRNYASIIYTKSWGSCRRRPERMTISRFLFIAPMRCFIMNLSCSLRSVALLKFLQDFFSEFYDHIFLLLGAPHLCRLVDLRSAPDPDAPYAEEANSIFCNPFFCHYGCSKKCTLTVIIHRKLSIYVWQ